jgi:hypothetical protein
MLFFGHIATSIFIADSTDSDPVAAVAGSLVPDVTDKSLGLLHLTPTRWLAHGLIGFAIASAGARCLLDDRRWRGFVLGYAGHLVCDLWANGKVPWLAPFGKKPPKQKRVRGIRHFFVYMLPEVIGLPFVWRRLNQADQEWDDALPADLVSERS